ncbi:hypothetical protein [Mycoplasma amphoriforme]
MLKIVLIIDEYQLQAIKKNSYAMPVTFMLLNLGIRYLEITPFGLY